MNKNTYAKKATSTKRNRTFMGILGALAIVLGATIPAAFGSATSAQAAPSTTVLTASAATSTSLATKVSAKKLTAAQKKAAAKKKAATEKKKATAAKKKAAADLKKLKAKCKTAKYKNAARCKALNGKTTEWVPNTAAVETSFLNAYPGVSLRSTNGRCLETNYGSVTEGSVFPPSFDYHVYTAEVKITANVADKSYNISWYYCE